MATELVKREVDGRSYEFEQFGAKQALKVLVRLSKIVGKPMALASGAFKKKTNPKERAELDPNMLAMAVEALTANATEDEVLSLIETLCSEKVLCDGAKVDFNRHYEGRLDHLFRVLSTALEVQYGNFLDVLKGSLD